MICLGNLEDSRSVTLMPSLDRAAAAYEPAGPPPMIRTWECCELCELIMAARERGRTDAGRERR